MSRNERPSQARQTVAQATSNLPGRPNASVVAAEPLLPPQPTQVLSTRPAHARAAGRALVNYALMTNNELVSW
ncbi:hypothetical protein ALI22I_13740 [Saccharothrix sp. ALI-22-I]|nr:hypothetical protein ALI22I_13740 [Saccharothrix sp. ALI-22-I]